MRIRPSSWDSAPAHCDWGHAAGKLSAWLPRNRQSEPAARLCICKTRRRGSTTRAIGRVDDGGTASYEGLYLSAQKRLSHGVTVLANYTWSHCISDPWDQNPTGGRSRHPGQPPAMAEQLRRDRSAATVRSERGGDDAQILQPGAADSGERLAGRADPANQVRAVLHGAAPARPGADHGAGPDPPNLVNTNPYPSQSERRPLDQPSPLRHSPRLGTYGNLGYQQPEGPGRLSIEPGPVAKLPDPGRQDASGARGSLQSSQSSESVHAGYRGPLTRRCSAASRTATLELRADHQRHQRK